MFNANAVLFAWVWGGNESGKWIDLDIDGTSVSFTVDFELDGFILVRCIEGTTTPDWSVTGDNVGRIYNKCEIDPCVSGTYSYSCSNWVNHN